MLDGPGPDTAVLGVHAPYPGRLMFEAQPGSLLAALAPFAATLDERGELHRLGLMDPGASSDEFYREFERVLRGSPVQAVCISSSTAAIEETARIVRTVRDVSGDEVLVVVGGPHEDGCEQRVADRIAGVDLSVAGQGQGVLRDILLERLDFDVHPRELLAEMCGGGPGGGTGKAELSSPWWGRGARREVGAVATVDADSKPRAWLRKRVRFGPFGALEVLPVMVTTGCAYGQCTFCAEALRERPGGGIGDLLWLKELADAHPGAALYFQDSIFPVGREVREKLLPLLEHLGRPWGCQVYLPMLSRGELAAMASAGCTYVYTGLESASAGVLAGVGKGGLSKELAAKRIDWMGEFGLSVGVSLMFGAMSLQGELLEDEVAVSSTVSFAKELLVGNTKVVGFYPNVQTVLPGTALARGLAAAGLGPDFYRVPRCDAFSHLEDGGVGYNFATLPAVGSSMRLKEHAVRVAGAGKRLAALACLTEYGDGAPVG